jgi:SAM-dependent methyltransferase
MATSALGHLAANLAAHQRQWGFVPTLTTSLGAVREEPGGHELSIRGDDGAWLRIPAGEAVAAAEAAAWIEHAVPRPASATCACLIGAHLGHAVGLVVARAPAARLLLLEPAAELLGLALDRHDWTSLIAAGRLMLLTGPDYHGRATAWRQIADPTVAPLVLVNQAAARARPGATRAAAQVIGQAVAGARANAAARARFATPYLLNTLANLAQFAQARDVRALEDRHRGRAAVIAAAGPSLNTNLAALTGVPDWRDRAVLIAVDTALKPMLAVNATPHYVVAVDPSVENARTLDALPTLDDTWLVAEASVDPACFASFGDRTALFRVSDTHEPWPWLDGAGLSVGNLRAWGSVLTTAFDFALRAGCDPVLFIGADLAYTGGQPYCRGTVYEDDWRAATATGTALEEVWKRQLPTAELVTLPDLHGHETRSSATLVAFRDWLVAESGATAPRRVVNATGSGVLHGSGIIQADLASTLRRLPPAPITPGAAHAAPLSHATAVAGLARAVWAHARVAPPAPFARWRSFTGGRCSSADAAGAIARGFPTLLHADPESAARLAAYAEDTAREADGWRRLSAATTPAAAAGAGTAARRPGAPGDWCLGPVAAALLPPGPVDAFRTYHALQLNARRLEHLATLPLPLRSRRVLEIGAGVGDLTEFFVDRGCLVHATDARPEHVALMEQRFAGHPLVTVQALDLDPPPATWPGVFDVVFCYGVLYHLSDPAAALDYMARACHDLLLLDTVVGDGTAGDVPSIAEDPAVAGAALSGRGSRPSRRWVWDRLGERFEHVYVPAAQPNHYEFPIDWTRPGPFTRRAIFVASRRRLDVPALEPALLDRQTRH